jgi:hypothetical protein
MDQPQYSKIIIPVPVSVSIVVISDARVLVKKHDIGFHFPFDYFTHSESATTQDCAAKLLSEITDVVHDGENWLPVDIRSFGVRKNIDNNHSLDIGYMTMLNTLDIPLVDEDEYEWKIVDFDKKTFPVDLLTDHESLWQAAWNMFDIMK